MKQDAMIRRLLKEVDTNRISSDLFFLAKNPLPCRKVNYTLPGHSKNTLLEADDFIEGQLRQAGYEIRREPVQTQASPPRPEDPWYTVYNLFGMRVGRSCPDEIIVVIAHKDSQSWIDSPGANDNAIGTAGVLEMARALSGYQFERTVWFLLCNEEHRPWSSVAAAKNAKERGDNLIAIFNTDGIGGKPSDQTSAGKKTNVTLYTAPEGEPIARLMCEVNDRFHIGLEQRIEKRKHPHDDDGSFVNAGYPAAVINIGSWPYGDPNYHAEGDIPELTDVENAAMVVKATVAAIVTLDQSGYPKSSPDSSKGGERSCGDS